MMGADSQSPWSGERAGRWGRWVLGAYLLGVLFVTIQKGVFGYPGNYMLFRGSFYHLLAGNDIYAPHPGYSGFKYSPTFALLFAPFALPWPVVGLFLWDFLNAMLLYAALDRLLPERPARIALALIYFDMLRSLQNSQSNALVAALVVLAFLAFERDRPWRAALAIGLGAAVKIFPAAAVVFAVWSRRKAVLAGALGAVAVVVVALPLVAIPPEEFARQYRSWFALLAQDSANRGPSVMGILYDWFGLAWPNWPVQLTGTIALLGPLALRRERWQEPAFRLLFLCSLLVYLVIFNHRAESAMFVVATTGVAVWWVTAPRARHRDALMALTFLLVSVTSLEIVPSWVRNRWVTPYDLKAVPCLLAWLVMQAELLGRTTAARPAWPPPAAR